jgi:DNA-binding NarL/FixJ family response regulator
VKNYWHILIVTNGLTELMQINRALNKGGFCFDSEHVQSEAELARRLQNCTPDLVIADMRTRAADWRETIGMVRKSSPGAPVLVLEENVPPPTTCLTQGVRPCLPVLETTDMAGLVVAVERMMESRSLWTRSKTFALRVLRRLPQVHSSDPFGTQTARVTG